MKGNDLPRKCQVMSMVLQGFVVLLQVKVGISQLAVDGAEYLKIFGSHLDGWLKKRDADSIVTDFTEPFTFKS